MRIVKMAFWAALLFSFCLSPASPQESGQPELAGRLREILRQYESNIDVLRNRITELERQLSDSEARSTSLLADLRASREALSSLTLQYEQLARRLDEYRNQLEVSRLRTESSLGSLTASMAALRARSLLGGSGLVLVLLGVILLLAR